MPHHIRVMVVIMVIRINVILRVLVQRVIKVIVVIVEEIGDRILRIQVKEDQFKRKVLKYSEKLVIL